MARGRPGDLPEGVREATGRRLSRLSESTNRALSVAAVVGTTFDLTLVEQVDGTDLLDEIAEACHAGLVIEEPGTAGRFRFAHAHRPAGAAGRARDGQAGPPAPPDRRAPRRRAHRRRPRRSPRRPRLPLVGVRVARRRRQGRRRLPPGGRAGRGPPRLRGGRRPLRDGPPGRSTPTTTPTATPGPSCTWPAAPRCSPPATWPGAREAIDALEGAVPGSERLAAWYSTYAGLLAVLAEPDRLTEIVRSIGAAADAMRALGDLRGEAQAHYVHATALERLGQIGAAERALDAALAAARARRRPRAGRLDPRRGAAGGPVGPELR